MTFPEHINKLETLKRLGSSYTGYRLFLAIGLLGILLISLDDLIIGSRHPVAYFFVSGIYAALCLINFLTFRIHQKHLQRQIFFYLIFDITHLTLILYLSSGPNIAIILLYMLAVSAATMLLNAKQAFILTLFSIIAVVYQQFFFSIFQVERNIFIGTSSLITLVFLSTYMMGQIAIKRLHFVESVAVDQRKAFVQLQQINQNIIEQLDTGFMVIDQSGKVVTLNQSAIDLLQLNSQSVFLQHHLKDIQPALYHDLHIYREKHFKGIFQFQPKDQALGLSIQYRPITTQQQQLILLVIESLQKINQQVQQLKLASLGQLSASIAHEIRNPLAAISQANDLLQEDLDTEHKQLTSIIQKQCLRINRTIEDTLNMSRQNKTLPESIMFYTWLKDFIAEDLSDCQKYLRITIENKIYLYFDPHQLRLVLINLIRNAIRHGHQLAPESRIDIKAHRIGELVFIDILDQGAGIPLSQQIHLFEPFYSTASDGTGLGLYLSRTFCEANHARLRYIPQAQGACFRIECQAIEYT